MTLAKTIASTLAVAALAFSLVPTAGAQTQAPAQTPPPAKTSQKRTHKTKPMARGEKKPATAAAAPAAAAVPKDAPSEAAEVIARRDPFVSLINASKGEAANLPPGKAGLVIATVRIDGTVKAQRGMIAVVSNPQKRVYFLHEGDRVYDGEVEKINLDGVVFRESTKDAFGKPVEREVTKRLYASAGEQQ